MTDDADAEARADADGPPTNGCRDGSAALADGGGPATSAAAFGLRSATIRSEIPNAATVAAAIAPDDTDDVRTRCEDDAVVVDVERPTTASLEATVDDYVVALEVASTVADHAGSIAGDDRADAGTDDADRGTGAADEQHDDRQTDDTNTR